MCGDIINQEIYYGYFDSDSMSEGVTLYKIEAEYGDCLDIYADNDPEVHLLLRSSN